MLRDRRMIAALAAFVVAIVVVGVVLAVGVRFVPDYPSVATHRDPGLHGTIAYRRSYGGDDCLFVVRASGGRPKQVDCHESYSSPAWSDDGTLIVSQDDRRDTYGDSEGTYRVRTWDPATRRTSVVTRRGYPPDDSSSSYLRGHGTLATSYDSATVRVSRGPWHGRVLLHADGPEDYHFTHAEWSPDGSWIVVSDSEGRLIVVRTDDPGSARLITDGTGTDGDYVDYSLGLTDRDVPLG